MSLKRVAVLLSVALCGAGMAVGQTVWEPYPDNPILGPGPPGSWDDGGRAVISVLFDGVTYHMWFLGWDAGVSELAFGHATSQDGLPPWEMDPLNPVLTRGGPGDWDGDGLHQGDVLYDGAVFHMWYSAFQGGVERGGYAWSDDGRQWQKDYANNPVLDVRPGFWDFEDVRPGAGVHVGDTYRMRYSRHGNGWHIGLAESMDGVNWTRLPSPVLPGAPGAWDSRVASPSVILDQVGYHMWYVAGPAVGNWSIGYDFLPDGIHWTRHPDNPVMRSDDESLETSQVVFDGEKFRMWFSNGVWPDFSISYATSTCCAGLFADDFETGDTSLWSLAVP